MYLVFDCETTGLPRNWKAPVSEVDNWPRVVQIAWAKYDNKGRNRGTNCYIVKPSGFTIPRDAQRVHGISTSRALADGSPLKKVLAAMETAVGEAEVLVAHNLRFDENVIGAEFLRSGMQNPFATKEKLCTMLGSTEFCRLPGPYGYKWPTLAELYSALFDVGFEDSHDAEADVLACAKCFFELRKRGVISPSHRRT